MSFFYQKNEFSHINKKEEVFFYHARYLAQVRLRDALYNTFFFPVEKNLTKTWMREGHFSSLLEKKGLLRRGIEYELPDDLFVYIDPRELIKIRNWSGFHSRDQPSSSCFIWKGDWDLSRGDLRTNSRYRFVTDIAYCRYDLSQTHFFKEAKKKIEAGKPWSCHHRKVILNTDEKILKFLDVYLGFIDDMRLNGFDLSKGKDELGVAVSREGKLIKINRGLHRLAMAQYLGLPSVPVKVKAVHRAWWEKVTEHTHGAEALERVVEALPHCVPETEPGTLDPHESPKHFTWP
ncbi:hypothetical protein [Halomonas sp. HL-93]|uniref:hypothetical protein n=1 Tax=Halomonas sp. HL-93 TaxID=1666906 RepID=UPI0007F091F6|nr:hypothetical protein [Halomonas sp. HL-93]SBR52480.1 hypothetical protein GA0071314_3733 [Halomonas sp. HL-93]